MTLRHMRPARGRGTRGVSKKSVSYREIALHLGIKIRDETLIEACKGLSRLNPGDTGPGDLRNTQEDEEGRKVSFREKNSQKFKKQTFFYPNFF